MVSRKLFSKSILLVPVLLSGCGGEDAFNGGGCNPADTITNISSFSVVGSTTDGNVEVVNGSNNFTLSWDLTSSCTYTYKLYLAVASTQIPGIDVEIDAGTCGHGLSCTYQVDVTCGFDSAGKTISCNGGPNINVAGILPDPSPSNRYFILSASNEMADKDTMASGVVRVDY